MSSVQMNQLIKPMHDRVLIERDVEETTKGGIVLAGQAQALGTARLGRRHPHLRHGRARDRRDRRRARRGPARRPNHLYQRHRLPYQLARRGLRLRPAAQLGRPCCRQAQLRPQL